MGNGPLLCGLKKADDSAEAFLTYEEIIVTRSEQLVLRVQHPVYKSDKTTKYQVHGVVGQGTFGRVLQVTRRGKRKFYAMKQLFKSQFITQDCLKKLERERNLVAAVDFPFIVKLICLCKDENCVYFVLEFAPCGDFAALLKEHCFDESSTRFYIAQIVMALEYLHAGRIVHRDVKPANLLVNSDGCLKLADFTFTKQLNDDRTFTICGTKLYMAPEIREGNGYGISVDWWAVGMITAEICRLYRIKMQKASKWAVPPSDDLAEFTEALMELNLADRLRTANDIRMHPFFSTINWTTFYRKNYTPPVERPPTVAVVRCDTLTVKLDMQVEVSGLDFDWFC